MAITTVNSYLTASGLNFREGTTGKASLLLDPSSDKINLSGNFNLGTGSFTIGGNAIVTGTSAIDSDTLATVTARGATTSSNLTLNGDITVASSKHIGIGSTLAAIQFGDGSVGNETADLSFVTNSDGEITFNRGGNKLVIGSTTSVTDGDFLVDTDTLYVDASENKVGIGTTAPVQKLTIAGGDVGIGFNKKLILRSDDVGASYLTYTNVGSQRTLLYGYYGIEFSTQNGAALNILQSNNVGIGTESPYGQLDIFSSNNTETDPNNAANYHLHLHNPLDDTSESIGIGFGLTSAHSGVGAAIAHERKGSNSYGDLYFSTRPVGGDVTERMRIAGDGNVGIGLTNPAYKLHLNDAATSTLAIQCNGNNAEGSKIRLIEGSSNFIGAYMHYDGSDNKFNLGVHNTDNTTLSDDTAVITIDRTTANVGIGSTDPASHALEVNGTISGDKILGKSGVYTYGKFGSVEAFGDAIYVGEVRTNSLSDKANNGNAQINFGGASKTLEFETDATARMFIAANGNVGIGIGATAANQKFTVGARSNFDSQNNYYGAWIDGNTAGDSWVAVGQWHNVGGRMEAGSTNMYIHTHNAGHDLVLQSGGANVGIGTNSPNKQVQIGSTDSNDVPWLRLQEDSSGGDKRLDLYVTGAVGTIASEQSSSELAFRTTDGEAMRIDPNGNVGIGTSSPAYHLDVTGIVNAYRYIQDGNVGSDFYAVTASRSSSSLTSPDIYDKNSHGLVLGGTHNEASLVVKVGGNVGIGTNDPNEKLELGAGGKIGLKDSAGTYDSVIYNDGTTFKVADGAGSYHVDKINLLGLLDLGVGHTIKGIDNSIIANKDILAPHTGSFGFRTYGSTNQYDAISSQFIDNSNNALSFNVKAGGTTSEAIRIDKDGNVGIGTSSPNGKLTISGDNNKFVEIVRTANNNPATLNEFSSYYSLSIQNRLAGSFLNFGGRGEYSDIQATDGAASATAKNISLNPYGGNVGIGTTNPTEPLTVKGSIVATNTSNVTIGGITYSSNHGRLFASQSDGTAKVLLDSNGVSYFDGGDVCIGNTSAGGKLDIHTDSSTTNGVALRLESSTGSYFVIKHGGNVGIGTNNPLHPLQISGAAHIEWGNTLTEDLVTIKGGGSAGDYDLLKVEAANGDDLFTVGGFTYDVLMPDSDTNVGIGTTTASAKVHLNGPSAGFSEILRLQRDGGNYYSIGLDNGDLNFCYNGQSADGSTLVIDGAADSVGIGTKNPSTELDVAGTGSFKRINIYNSTHNANPRLCVGRNDAEGFKFHVDDMFTKLSAHQDVDGDGDHRFIIDREFAGTGNNSFHIANSGNYQLTIDKDNKIGMGYNYPSDFNSEGNRLVIGDGAGSEGMTIYAGTSNKSSVLFADGTAGNTAYAGYVSYRHDSDRLDFGAGGGTRMVVNGNGAGIGTYTVDSKLTVSGAHSSSIAKFRNGSNTVEITDDADLLVDGKVGIGTTAPSYKLDVIDSNGSTLARFKDSDSSHAGLLIQGDTNGGTITNAAGFTSEVIYLQNSANAMRFYTDGTEAVRIDSSQRVGIGTNSVNGFTHINGRMLLEGPTVPSTLAISDSGDATKNLRLGYEPTWDVGCISASDYGAGWKDIVIAPHAGSVGIGTTNPPHTLSVKGTISRLNSSSIQVVNLGVSSEAGQVLVKNAGGVDKALINSNGVSYLNGGDVGIGTTSPSEKLHVVGHIQIDAGTNNNHTGQLGFQTTYDTAFLRASYTDPSASTETYLAFHANTAGAANGTVAEQMRIKGSNVGIGTTDPSSQFFNNLVVGNNDAGDKGITIRSNAGNKGVLAFSDTDSANAGRYDGYIAYGHTDNTMRFFTNAGNERMAIDNNGKVGIGTTSPSNTLQVGGQVRIDGSTTSALIVSSNAGASQGLLIYNNSDTDTASIINYYDGPLVLGQNNAEVMRLHSNGNVGIGTTNPSEAKLDIRGGNEQHLYIQGSNDSVTPTASIKTIAGGNVLLLETATVSDSRDILKAKNTNGTVFNLQANGQVGIGTETPAQLLHLEFSNTDTSFAGGGGGSWGSEGLLIENTSTTTDTMSIIQLRNGDADIHIAGIRQGTDDNDLGFFFEASEKVRFTHDGKVGIGVTDPDTLLEVAGVIKASSTSRVQADVLNNSANSANIIFRDGSMTRVGNSYSNPLVVEDGGNVGIGTSSPASQLHVEGTVQTKVYAIGSLPSASPAGQRAMVNNASSAFGSYTVGQTVSAGGSAVSPVYSDGSYWRYG